MSLTVWWATELYPDKNEESIGIAGEFPVIRLADLRAVVDKAMERVSDIPNSTAMRNIEERECLHVIQQLLAKLKGVGDDYSVPRKLS